MRTPFLGPAYTARYPRLANNRLINLYPELVEGAQGHEVGAFYPTPGLTLMATAGNGPIRGMLVGDNACYVVSGSGVYILNSSWGVRPLGVIGTSVGPLSMIWNGQQAAIFDAEAAYLIQGNILSDISLPFAGVPGVASYQDGYGILIQADSYTMWQSDLYDLSTWNALKFGNASSVPDYIVAIASLQGILWVLKQTGTEFWQDVGGSNFVFSKVLGAQVMHGCGAPYSPAIIGESLLWLTQDTQGQGFVVRGTGYTADRVSTHAIDAAIQSYPLISDAIGYGYQQDGHQFYVLTFPAGNTTWVYDLTASRNAKVPMWHQRAALTTSGFFARHQGNAYVFFNGLPLVGDWQNGNIYHLDPAALTDNGARRRWLRSWPALPKPSEATQRFGSLRIDMQTGLSVPSGTSPSLALRWSQDGGATWAGPRIAPAGPLGATRQRVQFNQLGSTRRGGGLDRIFELSSTDTFPAVLMGAELTQ